MRTSMLRPRRRSSSSARYSTRNAIGAAPGLRRGWVPSTSGGMPAAEESATRTLTTRSDLKELVLGSVFDAKRDRRGTRVAEGLGSQHLGRHARGRGVDDPHRHDRVRGERGRFAEVYPSVGGAAWVALGSEIQLAAPRKGKRGGRRKQGYQVFHGR